jgi:hypothetical protein
MPTRPSVEPIAKEVALGNAARHRVWYLSGDSIRCVWPRPSRGTQLRHGHSASAERMQAAAGAGAAHGPCRAWLAAGGRRSTPAGQPWPPPRACRRRPGRSTGHSAAPSAPAAASASPSTAPSERDRPRERQRELGSRRGGRGTRAYTQRLVPAGGGQQLCRRHVDEPHRRNGPFRLWLMRLQAR